MAELKPASELRKEKEELRAEPILNQIAEQIENSKHYRDSILVDAYSKGPNCTIAPRYEAAFRKLQELGYEIKDQGYDDVNRRRLFSVEW